MAKKEKQKTPKNIACEGIEPTTRKKRNKQVYPRDRVKAAASNEKLEHQNLKFQSREREMHITIVFAVQKYPSVQNFR